MVQTIDHSDQCGKVLDHFDSTSADQPDRAYFYFEAMPDDCPRALADHIYIEFDRYKTETNNPATGLRFYGQRRSAIWKALLDRALLDIVPGGRDQVSLQEAEQLVLDWINSRHLTVLYVVIPAEKEPKHLSEMIKGACDDLNALPRFQPGVRLMLFFACHKTTDKRSIFKWISGLRPGPKIPSICCILNPLRKLNRVDIEEWLSGFTQQQERRYSKDQLRYELGTLLKQQDQPYETVRYHLTNGGALRKARK